MIPVTANSAPALPCVCCREPGPVAVFDRDLDGMVCDDCRQKLMFGAAHLKRWGRIIGCTQTQHSRAPRTEGGAS